MLEPSRKSFSPTSLGGFIRSQAEVVKNMAEHIGPSEVRSVDEIAPGEGAIMRRGAFKIACYKSDDGIVTQRSAICTHVGCIVHWNTFEKCWVTLPWLDAPPRGPAIWRAAIARKTGPRRAAAL